MFQPYNVQKEIAGLASAWWQYPTVSAELTAIATALNTDPTTHDTTITTPPAPVTPALITHTRFTNAALTIVNMAKAGNVPNTVIADEIDAAIGTAYPPAAVTAPFASGTGAVGQTLTCTMGTWVGAPTSYAYQWQRDGVTIAGATAATYVLIAADSTHQIACVVTATNATGSASSTSNAIACCLMSPSDLVNPPPSPKVFDYPAATAIAFGIAFTAILLVVSGRFDPTGGAFTISILVTLAFVGVVAICLFYTIPNDEITSGAIGGLVAAFGAVVAHWLSRSGK